MKTHDIDLLLKEALQSKELPPPALIHQVKSVANLEAPRKQRRCGSRLLRNLAIAAFCLVIGVSAIAFPANFFGLRDLILPDTETDTIIIERPDGALEELSVQLISLQGFAGSPEHAAAVAWQNFLDTYDIEATLGATDNSWGEVPEQYWVYGAYSLEMVDKIHEIMERYGLALFGERLDIRTPEELQASIAYGPLFSDDSIWFAGYQFTCGTFQFDGQFGEIGFQVRSSRKGVFDNVFLNIGNIADYTEWNYENVHGTQLLLMQSDHKSLILLETEMTFIIVNIMTGTIELEQFADLIDFGQLRNEVPDLREAFEAERNERSEAVSAFTGRWTHVRSALDDGIELSMSETENGLEISEDRKILIWHGEGALEFHTGDSTDFAPGGWIITGELIPNGRYAFEINTSSMISHYTVNLKTEMWWEMQLQYDPVSGLLRHTDGEGIHHFYTRAS